MNKTKREILDTALRLFNERGFSEISLRAIAEEMNISPGNLTYHFKKREDIADALYYEFVDAVDKKFKALDPADISLKTVFDLILILTESRLKYRFLMRDFISLIADNPGIKKHYVKVIRLRKDQSLSLFKVLISQKIIRPEELENEYEYLYERIQILGNFWIASCTMQGEKLSQKVVSRNFKMIIQVIYPYLTAKGKKEWDNYTLISVT
ncbi:MAG: TetR family transcriptional regulator [Crocinitomicaceae bacterium]|nr:TetR family transcriptional regulator [Crocinitomicaceae bacterium]